MIIWVVSGSPAAVLSVKKKKKGDLTLPTISPQSACYLEGAQRFLMMSELSTTVSSIEVVLMTIQFSWQKGSAIK